MRVLQLAVAAAVAVSSVSAACNKKKSLQDAKSLVSTLSQLNSDLATLTNTVASYGKTVTSSSKTRDAQIAALEKKNSGGGSGDSKEPVKWRAQGCTVSQADGTLVKYGCGNGWNGGATSTRNLPGDGALEFRCTKAQHTMVGLSTGNNHNSYQDIECALYCDNSNLKVYESGRYMGSIGKYEDYQVMRVVRKGTVVTFYQAGQAVKVCTKRLSGDLIADTSIYKNNAGGVLEAKWDGTTAIPETSSVTWTRLVCTKVDASGSIMKAGCGNGWNGGGVSSRSATGDITLQFTCTKAQHSMIGLSNDGSTHNSYQDIACAAYCDQGRMRFYENGRYKGQIGSYNSQQILEIKRVGTKVTFFRQGKKMRDCSLKLPGTVVADISIHNQGRGGIESANWVGQIGKLLVSDVVWKVNSCTATGVGGTLWKARCGNGWNGGAYSTKQAAGNIAVEFRCDTAQHAMLGLSKGTSGHSYTDIDCALYCDRGKVASYERGRSKWRGQKYTNKDVFTVKRAGTVVSFLQNGIRIRTCSLKLSGKVLIDVSLYRQGGGGFGNTKWLGKVV